MFSKTKKFMFICLVLGIFTSVAGQDYNITIPLNQTITAENKQLYEGFIHLNHTSTVQVNLVPILVKNVSFIIFQAHSHLFNVTLYQDVKQINTTVVGTNVGLFSSMKNLSTFYIDNANHVEVKLFIAVQGYGKYDPVPGGCNMVYNVPKSPFMITSFNEDYITIDAAPAQLFQQNEDCNLELWVRKEFYLFYLPEQNLGADVYFDAIANMTTLDNIKRIGRLIPLKKLPYRSKVSAYPGTGAIYVIVAYGYYKNYSVYVPNHSYGCYPHLEDDCEFLKNSLSELMCSMLPFIGLFICYFGHRFFKIQTFLNGFLTGLVLTYILISLSISMDRPAQIFASAISGIFIGALRTVHWWLYGLPVFSIIMTSADIGFLTSSLVYYGLPDNVDLSYDLLFWLLFIMIMLLLTVILLFMSSISNLLCCTIIGGYASIFAMDVYLGSNLKYILINIIRRATVTGFNDVSLMVPFQIKDTLLVVLWMFLIATGFAYQYIENRGRPPFPPPPRSVRAVPEEPAAIAGPSGYRRLLSRHLSSIPSERTPLL